MHDEFKYQLVGEEVFISPLRIPCMGHFFSDQES